RWARGQGKRTIITTAGTIQEIFCNPEITIAIFSATKALAQEILAQIKREFETNECLKEIFKDVLFENPCGRGPDGRPAKWSLQRGITVKRKGKPTGKPGRRPRPSRRGPAPSARPCRRSG